MFSRMFLIETLKSKKVWCSRKKIKLNTEGPMFKSQPSQYIHLPKPILLGKKQVLSYGLTDRKVRRIILNFSVQLIKQVILHISRDKKFEQDQTQILVCGLTGHIRITEGSRCLYQFPRASKAKYHKLSVLKQQKFISSQSRGQKSNIKVSMGLYALSQLLVVASKHWHSLAC